MFNYKKYAILVALIVFLYFLLVFDANFRGPDEPVYFSYTASIIEDGDLNIVNQFYSDYGQYVSKVYNLPDFHNSGGVVFWAPFYIYGKVAYFLTSKLNITTILYAGLTNVIKCAVSFSTIIFGFFALFFTYLLCKKLFNDRISLWSSLFICFATPFAYYVIFETGNGQIVATMLAAVLFFTLYTYAPKMHRSHWFLYGMLFSTYLNVRVEQWPQFWLFIVPFVFLLCLKKRVLWSSFGFLIAGLLPLFILRCINSYLKFGIFRPEELFYINSFLKFNSAFQFNGMFSTFRGVIYSSPVVLMCLTGSILSIFNLFLRIKERKEWLNEFFIAAASVYLFFKIFSLSKIFSPAGDALTGRCFILDYPMLVLLYGYSLNALKDKVRVSWLVLSMLFLIWNLIVIAEYIAGFDWLYVTFSPGLLEHISNLQFISFTYFSAKDIFLKCLICLPILLATFAIFCLIRNLAVLKSLKKAGGSSYMRFFSFFSIILCVAYILITFVNIINNGRNVKKMKNSGFLRYAQVIKSNPSELSEYEKEEQIWTFFKEKSYYALKGDINKMHHIDNKRAQVFADKPRLRMDQIPFQIFKTWPAFYNTDNRYDKAVECYNKSIAIDSRDFESYISLGNIYGILGDYKNAIDKYKIALSINPNILRLYVIMGNLYELEGDFDMAVSSYLEAIRRNPSLAEAYKGLATIFSLKNDYLQAITYYQRYLQLNPQSSEGYQNLADAYGKVNDYPRQIESLNKAIQLNPRLSEAYRNLAEAYGIIGEYEKAITYYQRYLQLNPNSGEAYNSLADMYRKNSDPEKAIECYSHVIRFRQNDPWVYFDLGETYNMLNDSANALKQINILRKLNREDLVKKLEGSLRRE